MPFMGRITALLLAVLLSGCATVSGQRDPKDPWESMNRTTHAFNEALDDAILKPMVTGYVNVAPAWVREGVNNFFGNLEDVGNGLNNILQGKPKEGVSDLGRFAVNSVIGIFGLWDIASPLGLAKHDEDFGQTLGLWGVPSGPYLVLPLLGPSSARDGPARIVDPQFFFYTYAIDDNVVGWFVWGVDKFRARANLLQAGDLIDAAALDKYLFIRDAWLQRRQNMVYDGSPPRPKEDD
jgi:phospholipid-binding lipoprotein MlaA